MFSHKTMANAMENLHFPFFSRQLTSTVSWWCRQILDSLVGEVVCALPSRASWPTETDTVQNEVFSVLKAYVLSYYFVVESELKCPDKRNLTLLGEPDCWAYV